MSFGRGKTRGTELDQWLPGAGDQRKVLTTKRLQGTFWEDGYYQTHLYFNYSGGYMPVHIPQNTPNCILKRGKLYCIKLYLNNPDLKNETKQKNSSCVIMF